MRRLRNVAGGRAASRAALACVRGQVDVAIRELRAYLKPATVPPLFASAARRHLGVLLGGAEGQALVAQADAFFEAGGVQDPGALRGPDLARDLDRAMALGARYRLQYWMPRSIFVGAKTLLTSTKQPLSRSMPSSLGWPS